ncbi:L-type lectin-domain containing receptor kinase IV.1-like [Aegilops tauschii subsp. strangulata]|uniref:non-specific serine/threonine protein kinase n=1 Tax=Triticum aestivum TaxID=4565 RepID=A0A3B6JN28_WHEAT|nr:L-type lectin-domain containing receptor kinase IV.1-like [Aegilops tauschii subsp. strangulata]XP_044378189.1 L-type lectin-domain containing receptor kinase IV.1-like [Triticum aestivum]
MAASGAALCLSFVLLLVAVCCNSDVDFIYQGFQHAPNLSLDGSASVLRGGALQLTNGSERLVGHAFYGSPVALGTLDDSQSGGGLAVSSFSTAFVFDIVTVGTGGGHGLAFVVAPSRALPGASPEIYLGVLGPTTNGKASNHVFAVEFDTVTDLEMKETNGNHVGVDVNSLVSNVSEQAAYYTAENRKVPVKLESAQQIQAWIDYDGGTSLLNVTVAPVSVADRPQRPLISTKLDLRSVFKENMYVGFSSATGKLASSHYILAWSFRANGPAQPIDLRRLPKVPRQRTPAPKVLIIKFAAVACAGTLTLVAAAMVTVLWLRRRAALADKLEEWELEHPQRIPYIELYKATKGFRESGLLGSGGFGHVYKGVLGRRRSGEEVAIKRISSGTKQGMREFVAEISSLGRMRHRNLVELRGWCKHGNDLLLVYEFMPNGSLDAHLFGGGNKVLTWAQRLSVIRGVARGLLYLHEEWEHVVVHRDVKANNVLLGADMGARLGDFGLARLYEHGAAPGTTRVAGTLGYMAPELTVTSRATTATDVFSFGALLLEVACGRRPVEPGEAADVILVRWVRDCGLDGDLLRAVDPRLDGCYDAAEARLVLWLGMVCSQGRPEARPSMRQACQFLNGEETLPEDAVLMFSDPDSSVFPGSVLSSMTWSSSCGTMSVGSLHGGR